MPKTVYQEYEHQDAEIMSKITKQLLKEGILTEILSDSHKAVRAIGRIDGGIHRRVDLLLTKIEELGAAQLYFTGNDIL